MRAAWDWYWQETGGNVLSMPMCGVIAIAFTLLCRKPIVAWWRKHFGAQADLDEIRDLAAGAHKIAADLFEHHTGHPHPQAPKEGT